MSHRQIFMGSLIFILLLGQSVWARPEAGSCEGFTLPLKSDGKSIDTSIPARVTREGTEVYESRNDNRIVRHLTFGDTLKLVEISTSAEIGRIKVRNFQDPPGSELGWVERHDLLCVAAPLIGKRGLERKAFVNTSAQRTEGQPPSETGTPVYRSYDPNFDCRPENDCASLDPLGRFELYYIVAEDTDNRRYLLSADFNLIGNPTLKGWIDECDMIPWDTALQLRPEDDVDHIKATPGIISPNLRSRQCASPFPEKAKKSVKDEGVSLAGGLTWYTLPYHIPILDKRDNRYQMAAPGQGLADIEGHHQLVRKIEGLKEIFTHVDVFFLMDGTKSMGPYIEQTKQFANDLVDKIQKHPDYEQTSFRFGFRVYRDDFDGNEGLGEYLELSSNCSTSSNSPQNFKRKLEPVEESAETKDGYPENLFGGLDQALSDMEGCTDYLKLLFVLGEHGDNISGVPSTLTDKLNDNFDHFVVFFVQVKGKGYQGGYSNSGDCFNAQEAENFSKSNPVQAYQRFQRQVCDIFQVMAPQLNVEPEVLYDNHLLHLTNPKQLIDKIKRSVVDYSNTGTLQETVERLRSGQSVQKIVEDGMRTGDLPVVYWRQFEKAACESLPDLCESPSYQDIFYMHAPTEADWVEEIWMSSHDFHSWRSLLEPLRSINPNMSTTEQKENFVKALRMQIQSILGPPTLNETGNIDKQLEKRKVALPMREDSPLLQYTFKEIRNTQDCEFNRLTEWVKDIYSILDRVAANPRQKVTFKYRDYDNSLCRGISEKGKKIRNIEEIEVSYLNRQDESFSYMQEFRGMPVYIIPLEFLP